MAPCTVTRRRCRRRREGERGLKEGRFRLRSAAAHRSRALLHVRPFLRRLQPPTLPARWRAGRRRRRRKTWRSRGALLFQSGPGRRRRAFRCSVRTPRNTRTYQITYTLLLSSPPSSPIHFPPIAPSLSTVVTADQLSIRSLNWTLTCIF